MVHPRGLRRDRSVIDRCRPWLGPVLLIAGLAALLEQLLRGGPLHDLDLFVARSAALHHHTVVVHAAGRVAQWAQPMLVVPLFAAAATAWGLCRRSRRPVFLAVVGTLLLVAVVVPLKAVIARDGPSGVLASDGRAWPSGHVTTAVMAWGLTAAVLPASWRGVRMLLRAVPALVGIAMIVSDAHWVSDVLAGWLMGPLLVAAAVAAVDRLESIAGRSAGKAPEGLRAGAGIGGRR